MYTKGPWVLRPTPPDSRAKVAFWIDGAPPESVPIADVKPFSKHHTNDAALIAAAPDLLEALELILPAAQSRWGGTTDGQPLLDKARSAIARATKG